MLGIALVDKPYGMSSHDAIYRARRALGIKKIGHAGTLDPNATGLLLMAVGGATRFLPYLQLEPKVYEGVLKLGESTATQDSEGEVTQARPIDTVTLEAVRTGAARLTGDIEQIPPMFSAVKIAGQRLYKIARKGGEVERPPRRIAVHEFTILSLEDGSATFRVVCSGGTYVRTLAHDLGEALGVGAHLTALRRNRIGAFDVASSHSPEELTVNALIPLDQALAPLAMIRLPAPAEEAARHGGEFAHVGDISGDRIGLVDDNGLYAIAVRLDARMWRAERVLPPT